MTDQPSTPDPDDNVVDPPLPEEETPPLTDPSTIPPDEGDAGNV